MTYFTSAAAVLGEPSIKGHTLAQEEINAQGGLLGKRKIETIIADEAAGTDACVKELRRMKLDAKIDIFTGVISSNNTPALGPVAEELSLLTMFGGGTTDFLFDKAVPNPKYVFRIPNIQSADFITAAVGVARTWPDVRTIAHIHPDSSYGRNASEHFTLAFERLVPGTEVVSESWPKLFSTDFTAHITKIMSAQPDLLVASVWGGDYVAFYKQALRYGLFDKMKVATTIAFGIAPHAIGRDHPESVLAGVASDYHFTYPRGDRWPLNKSFVERYYKRWNEYPNFLAEAAYTALYLYKKAVEKANKLIDGWPDDEMIISQLEGLGMDAPSGYLYMRPDHQAYKDAVTGFSENLPQYEFASWDPDRVITIPIRNITAPMGWPKPSTTHNESTAAATWIKTTWPKNATDQYPEFPWPPPQASATAVIPPALLRGSGRRVSRLSDVDEVIVGALASAGYFEKSYYAVPDGYAMVFRIERINDDGTPKALPDRWATDVPPMRKWDLGEYLRRLFLAQVGYYRVVAILISPHAFSQTGAAVTRDQATAWLTAGLNKLPEPIRGFRLSDAYTCTALIYEFEQPEAGKEITLRLPGRLGAMTHLRNSGIWAGFAR